MMEETKKQDLAGTGTMSVIGGGITITGNIEAEVDLQIAGQVNGDVRCATLILDENSVIRGSVYAERVRASGVIEGAVETRDLAVEATARLKGDVTYSRIRIANGGIVDGRMSHHPVEEEAGEGSRLRLVEAATHAAPKRKQPDVYIE
jgi:cytoskeletal protein CcmA (bactofilin family)